MRGRPPRRRRRQPRGSQRPRRRRRRVTCGWTYDALGFRYTIAFLILSFAFFTLLIMNILQIRRVNMCPAQLVESFEAQVNEKQAQAAYELAKNDPSILGKCLAAGVEKIQGGHDAAMKAMSEVGEDENMKIGAPAGLLGAGRHDRADGRVAGYGRRDGGVVQRHRRQHLDSQAIRTGHRYFDGAGDDPRRARDCDSRDHGVQHPKELCHSFDVRNGYLRREPPAAVLEVGPGKKP